MNQTSELGTIMRSICASLEKPVIVVLLCILAFTLVLVGTIIAEAITERRHLRVWLPKLVDDIKKQEIPPALCIKRSGLLKRQKISLIEVTDHKELTNQMREALAVRLIDEARGRCDKIVKLSGTRRYFYFVPVAAYSFRYHHHGPYMRCSLYRDLSDKETVVCQ